MAIKLFNVTFLLFTWVLLPHFSTFFLSLCLPISILCLHFSVFYILLRSWCTTDLHISPQVISLNPLPYFERKTEVKPPNYRNKIEAQRLQLAACGHIEQNWEPSKVWMTHVHFKPWDLICPWHGGRECGEHHLAPSYQPTELLRGESWHKLFCTCSTSDEESEPRFQTAM